MNQLQAPVPWLGLPILPIFVTPWEHSPPKSTQYWERLKTETDILWYKLNTTNQNYWYQSRSFISRGLKILYSFLCRKYINHILGINFLVSLFFYFIIFTFTHMYTVWATLPQPASRPNLFLPLVPLFFWRQNIRDNKKDTAF
jgi:hypothetical protein